eukprot:10893156-Alexandrium_andersonii.AAC.1
MGGSWSSCGFPSRGRRAAASVRGIFLEVMGGRGSQRCVPIVHRLRRRLRASVPGGAWGALQAGADAALLE